MNRNQVALDLHLSGHELTPAQCVKCVSPSISGCLQWSLDLGSSAFLPMGQGRAKQTNRGAIVNIGVETYCLYLSSFFENFAGSKDCNITQPYIYSQPQINSSQSSICKNRAMLLEALGSGERHGFNEPFTGRGNLSDRSRERFIDISRLHIQMVSDIWSMQLTGAIWVYLFHW